MKNKKKKIQILAFLLIAVLFTGSIIKGMQIGTVEPDNPITEDVKELRIDTMQLGGNSNSDRDTNEEQSEKETEDTQDSEEETQSEEQTEENRESEQNESNPVDESEQAEQEPDNGETSENLDQQPDNGENSSDQEENNSPEENDSGNLPVDGGDSNLDNPGTGETPGENEPGLITNLYSRIITTSELENDILKFYVYYSDSAVASNVKVNYKHKNESGTGTYLTAEDGKNYETRLSLGQNYITVYYTDADGVRNFTRFIITYQAEKADETTPEIGEHPPNIDTNLDGWIGDIKTSNFTFVVSARTWENKIIYSNHIVVMMDGKVVSSPTGSGTYEYELYFERSNTSDYTDHEITVLAWDDEGNSRYMKYQVVHHAHDEGEALGSVYVIIDATTVNCGIVDEVEVEANSGDTAATVVLKALDELGYSYVNDGSAAANFYLRSISRADAFRGCSIESRLRKLIERDGLSFYPAGTRDKLGEFDFTSGSGWMYFINGSLCPGKGMSAWKLNGGETIQIRFTLAYGKDLGISVSGYGSLSNYCAAWVNDEIVELGHSFTITSRVEPTGKTDGYIESTCSKCGEVRKESLPATGSPEQTPEETPGQTPEQTPEETPGQTPEQTPEETPGQTSEQTPEETSGQTSEQTTEESSDPTSENKGEI